MVAAKATVTGGSPRWAAFAAFLLSPLLIASPQPAAAAAEASAREYDLTVLVFAAGEPPQMALSYSRTVDHNELRAGIENLLARVGAEPMDLVIQDGPLQRGSTRLATGAQLVAPGLVEQRTGMLPVGLIIRSVPAWTHMRLVFILGDDFRFSGPTDATADGFALTLVNRMKAYEYDVERKSGTVVPPEEARPPRPRAVSLLPAVLIGLPTGFLSGWVFGARRRVVGDARRG